MTQPIDGGRPQDAVGEGVGPLRDIEVGGHDGALALVALGDHIVEVLILGAFERLEAEVEGTKGTPVQLCILRVLKHQFITGNDALSSLHTSACRRWTQPQPFSNRECCHPQFLDRPVGKDASRHCTIPLLAPR